MRDQQLGETGLRRVRLGKPARGRPHRRKIVGDAYSRERQEHGGQHARLIDGEQWKQRRARVAGQ